MTVLIVSEPVDVHADAVVRVLNQRNVPVFRLHPEVYPRDCELHLDIRAGKPNGFLRSGARKVDLQDVTAAWFRRIRHPPLPDGLSPECKVYFDRQVRWMFRNLWAALGERWVVSPNDEAVAEQKLLQLCRAHEVGLSTPTTLMTNSPDEVEHLRTGQGGGRVAVKPFVVEGVFSGWRFRMPFTSELTERAEPTDAIALAPAMYQAYIPKLLELRCVVIGDRVFAASLDSQALPAAQHDSRNAGNDDLWNAFDLPDEIARKLVELTRLFRLRFCSADLILTPEGDYVFLDLNPNGQWLWLEVDAGLPLSEAMADLLCGC